MAAVETLSDVKANILLNEGTTVSGSVKTSTQSLGTLNKDAWDVDKVVAIMMALAPLFTKSVYKVNGVKTFSITGE